MPDKPVRVRFPLPARRKTEKNKTMQRSTILRMQLAEDRLRWESPAMHKRARELKERLKSLYELDDYEFANLIPRALALNIRDGHCHDMTERKEATDGND